MITFDEKSHTYKCAKTGRELISATTLIGKYKKPFDKMENLLESQGLAKKEEDELKAQIELIKKELPSS